MVSNGWEPGSRLVHVECDISSHDCVSIEVQALCGTHVKALFGTVSVTLRFNPGVEHIDEVLRVSRIYFVLNMQVCAFINSTSRFRSCLACVIERAMMGYQARTQVCKLVPGRSEAPPAVSSVPVPHPSYGMLQSILTW